MVINIRYAHQASYFRTPNSVALYVCWAVQNLFILIFIFLSISKKQRPTPFTLCENAPVKRWKSNPRQTIGHSCHEKSIYHGENVLKKINGAFYGANSKNKRWKEQLQAWIWKKGNERRILQSKLTFYGIFVRRFRNNRKLMAWMSKKTW